MSIRSNVYFLIHTHLHTHVHTTNTQYVVAMDVHHPRPACQGVHAKGEGCPERAVCAHPPPQCHPALRLEELWFHLLCGCGCPAGCILLERGVDGGTQTLVLASVRCNPYNRWCVLLERGVDGGTQTLVLASVRCNSYSWWCESSQK